ncbi:MAG TPA: hypothetical protein VGO93_01810, partial [Candidatus Xenobia bacterium]
MRVRLGGFALGTTFMVAFLVLLAGFTMAGLASLHYNLAAQELRREEAFEGANAGLAEAMAQFVSNATWGASLPVDHTADVLPVTSLGGLPAPTDAVSFYVTFADPATHPGYPHNLPVSINNFNGSTTVTSAPDPNMGGRPHFVPPGCSLVFVEAVAGQASQRQPRILEALLQAPSYQYVLAASNAVVTWDDLSGFYAADAYRASRIDGVNCQDVGSIFVGPSKGNCYTGGWCGGVKTAPSGPYGVYLGPGSIVTGQVTHDGRTNVKAACPPPRVCCFPNMGNAFSCPTAHRTPEAAGVGTPCPKCPSDILPHMECAAAISSRTYTCPKTYRFCGCGVGACGRHYKWYTQARAGGCCPGFKASPPTLCADTFIEACGQQIKLSNACTPVVFNDNYTLAVHGYLCLPGGFAGPARSPGCCGPTNQKAAGTVLILPVAVPTAASCPAPCANKYSHINLWPPRSAGAIGADSCVSILATGQVLI